MNLSDLKKLCEAATPGPWETYDNGDGRAGIKAPSCRLGKMFGDPMDPEGPERDARFIAAARTYLPKLLAVAEAAKSEDGYARARYEYDARVGEYRCSSVDGHGTSGICYCHEKAHAAATKAKREALAALEAE